MKAVGGAYRTRLLARDETRRELDGAMSSDERVQRYLKFLFRALRKWSYRLPRDHPNEEGGVHAVLPLLLLLYLIA
jgi:hypothetical protein